MIKKPLAGVVAGVLLVGGGALATAQADHVRGHESESDSTTSATERERMQEPTLQPRLASGASYDADTTTTTNVRVPSRVQYGAAPQARVSVSTADAGTPRGRVEVGVDGVWASERLLNGSATVGLPRDLQPDWTYNVKAEYAGRNDFKASRDVAQMRVIKANSRARVDAPNRSRRQRPRVATTVTTDTGVPARGKVRVTISKRRAEETKTVRLRGGDAVVRFPRVARGRWDVKVVYTGSNTVQRDVAHDSFRRTRR